MTPLWFSVGEHQCFGWWHLPVGGRARSAAILCPPLGMEHLVAHRTMRTLAESLSSRGVASLRFDYPGTGDSTGDLTSPNLVSAWLRSIEVAVAEARTMGLHHVSVIGLRMGANLAWEALSNGLEADGVVLWDPCPSGLGFLREKRALQLLEFPETANHAADDRGFDTPGFYYPQAIADDLRRLAIGVEGALTNPSLLLTRPDKAVGPKVRLLAEDPGIDVAETVDQGLLFDVPDIYARVPQHTVASIATWIADRAPDATIECLVNAPPAVVVDCDDSGGAIVERAVYLGESKLFAIVTEGASIAGPTVFLTNTAVTYHVGPNRMWVEAAREAAAHGCRVVRFDVGDVGDSSRGSEPDGPYYYTQESLDDVTEALESLPPRGEAESVVVGLCSGAWMALMLAGEGRSLKAVLLNPLRMQRRPNPMGPHGRTIPSIRIGVHKRAARWKLLEKLVVLGWRTAATLHVVNSSTGSVCSRATRNSDIVVFIGREERVAFDMAIPLFASGRIERRDNVDISFVEHGDHALLTRAVREVFSVAVLAAVTTASDERIGLSS